jgi:hypothetical protein
MNYKITKDGSYRYNNVGVMNTPSEQFPDMVTIFKTPSVLKPLAGRKYITLEKAIKAIDTLNAERLISKGNMKVGEELTGVFGLEVALEL